MTSFIEKTSRASALALALGLCVPAANAAVQNRDRGGQQNRDGMRGGMSEGRSGMVEPQREPHGYTRFQPPHAISQRPRTPDANLFHHNFTARRGYHIGPYHGPVGFEYRRFRYGEILPRMFWAPEYLLSDYWLFGLDVPPVGYEWVRYGPDALLVDMNTGEVVSEVYDSFL